MLDLSQTLEPWHAQLREDVSTRALSQGVIASVRVGSSTRADFAYGVDGVQQALDANSIVAIHCAGKPLLAVALAVLVDRGALSFDDSVHHYLETGSDGLGNLTLRELLTHRAGLSHLHARDLGLQPLKTHRRVVLGMVPRNRGALAYAEYASWLLLGEIASVVAGGTPRDVVDELVLTPIGLGEDLFFGVRDEHYDRLAPALRTNSLQLERGWLPVLRDIGRRRVTEIRAANGAYGRMSGLADFYSACLAQSAGHEVWPITRNTWELLTSPAGPSELDPIMERPCSYGYGFMTRLHEHYFGSATLGEAYGHSGDRSTTFAFCDPTIQLACAVQYFGVVDKWRAFHIRREDRVDDLYRCLAGAIEGATA